MYIQRQVYQPQYQNYQHQQPYQQQPLQQPYQHQNYQYQQFYPPQQVNKQTNTNYFSSNNVDQIIADYNNKLALEKNDKQQALLRYVIKYCTNVNDKKLKNVDPVILEKVVANFNNIGDNNFVTFWHNGVQVHCFFSYSKQGHLKLQVVRIGETIGQGSFKEARMVNKVNKNQDKEKRGQVVLRYKSTLPEREKLRELRTVEQQNNIIKKRHELKRYCVETNGMTGNVKNNIIGFQKNAGVDVETLLKKNLLTVNDNRQILQESINIAQLLNNNNLYNEDGKFTNNTYNTKTKEFKIIDTGLFEVNDNRPSKEGVSSPLYHYYAGNRPLDYILNVCLNVYMLTGDDTLVTHFYQTENSNKLNTKQGRAGFLNDCNDWIQYLIENNKVKGKDKANEKYDVHCGNLFSGRYYKMQEAYNTPQRTSQAEKIRSFIVDMKCDVPTILKLQRQKQAKQTQQLQQYNAYKNLQQKQEDVETRTIPAKNITIPQKYNDEAKTPPRDFKFNQDDQNKQQMKQNKEAQGKRKSSVTDTLFNMFGYVMRVFMNSPKNDKSQHLADNNGTKESKSQQKITYQQFAGGAIQKSINLYRAKGNGVFNENQNAQNQNNQQQFPYFKNNQYNGNTPKQNAVEILQNKVNCDVKIQKNQVITTNSNASMLNKRLDVSTFDTEKTNDKNKISNKEFFLQQQKDRVKNIDLNLQDIVLNANNNQQHQQLQKTPDQKYFNYQNVNKGQQNTNNQNYNETFIAPVNNINKMRQEKEQKTLKEQNLINNNKNQRQVSNNDNQNYTQLYQNKIEYKNQNANNDVFNKLHNSLIKNQKPQPQQNKQQQPQQQPQQNKQQQPQQQNFINNNQQRYKPAIFTDQRRPIKTFNQNPLLQNLNFTPQQNHQQYQAQQIHFNAVALQNNNAPLIQRPQQQIYGVQPLCCVPSGNGNFFRR